MVAFLSLSQNAIAGRGPFVSQSPAENVLSLQIFLIAISLPSMLLVAPLRSGGTMRRRCAEMRRPSAPVTSNSPPGRTPDHRPGNRAHADSARELHDDINQQLASLAIAFSGLKRRLPRRRRRRARHARPAAVCMLLLWLYAIRYLSYLLYLGSAPNTLACTCCVKSALRFSLEPNTPSRSR